MVTRRDMIKLATAGLAGTALDSQCAITRSALALRGAMMGGGKKGPTARDYVQDGLVAMWDGIENAGWGVHDNSATIWQDLLRPIGTGIPTNSTMTFADDGLSVTVDKGVWFGGNTASTYYFQNFPTDKSSFECVFTVDEYSENCGVANGIFGLQIGNARSFIYGKPWSVKHYSWPAGMGFANYAYNASSFFGAPGKFHVAWSQNDDGLDCMYINGALVKTAETKTSPMSYAYPVKFNKPYSDNGGIGGMYHSMRVYNRALTSAEIAANYAVDAARFSI